MDSRTTNSLPLLDLLIRSRILHCKQLSLEDQISESSITQLQQTFEEGKPIMELLDIVKRLRDINKVELSYQLN